MAGHEIEIDIKPDGTFSFGVKGVKGKSCKEVTKFLEELGDLINSETTSEYFEEEVQETQEEHIHLANKK